MSENAANNIIVEKNICKDDIISELQKKKDHLFYCLECEELAHNIAAQSHHINLQPIKWKELCLWIPKSVYQQRARNPRPAPLLSLLHAAHLLSSLKGSC